MTEEISGKVGDVVYYGKDTPAVKDDMVLARVGDGVAKFYHQSYTGGDDQIYGFKPSYALCKVWENLGQILDQVKTGEYLTLDGHLLEQGVHGITKIADLSTSEDICCGLGAVALLGLGVFGLLYISNRPSNRTDREIEEEENREYASRCNERGSGGHR